MAGDTYGRLKSEIIGNASPDMPENTATEHTHDAIEQDPHHDIALEQENQKHETEFFRETQQLAEKLDADKLKLITEAESFEDKATRYTWIDKATVAFLTEYLALVACGGVSPTHRIEPGTSIPGIITINQPEIPTASAAETEKRGHVVYGHNPDIEKRTGLTGDGWVVQAEVPAEMKKKGAV